MRLFRYVLKTSYVKIFNIKFGTFVLVIVFTGWIYNKPLKSFVLSMDYPVNWCVFPFLMCSYTFLILFWLAIIYIHSDVPFMQHANMYQVIRTGRKRWAFGQILGIMIRSFCAVGITVFGSILPFFSHIEWTNEWGKLLKTAAVTNAAEGYRFEYVFYYDIFNKYTPLQLMLLCVLICWLVASFLGILMFLFCLLFNKVVAVASAAALALMLFPVLNIHPKIRNRLALYVPTIWAEVARVSTPDHGFYWLPSVAYMLGFLTAGILILSIIIMIRMRHVEFHWVNEDV